MAVRKSIFLRLGLTTEITEDTEVGAVGASVQLSEFSVQQAPEAPIVILIVIEKTWMNRMDRI